MKSKFSTAWKSSSQTRKQRKYRANAPLHTKYKFLSANLSKELRKKHKIRSIPVRKGDTVKIMRGSFKGKQGKISLINLKKGKVMIEGIQRGKMDGSKANVKFNASNLQIQELYSDDIRRIKNAPKKTQSK